MLHIGRGRQINKTMVNLIRNERDSDKRILVSWLEGNLQYLYIVSKKYKQLEDLKCFLEEKLAIFKSKKTLSEEAEVTKAFLESMIVFIDSLDSMDNFRNQIWNMVMFFAKKRLEYHELQLNDPDTSLSEICEGIYSRI